MKNLIIVLILVSSSFIVNGQAIGPSALPSAQNIAIGNNTWAMTGTNSTPLGYTAFCCKLPSEKIDTLPCVIYLFTVNSNSGIRINGYKVRKPKDNTAIGRDITENDNYWISYLDEYKKPIKWPWLVVLVQ